MIDEIGCAAAQGCRRATVSGNLRLLRAKEPHYYIHLEFSQWNTVFGDNRLTAALVDRLIHHSHIVIFSGESYRLTSPCSASALAEKALQKCEHWALTCLDPWVSKM